MSSNGTGEGWESALNNAGWPRLRVDAMVSVECEITKQHYFDSDPEQANCCAMAVCLREMGHTALVGRTVAYLLMTVDQALADHVLEFNGRTLTIGEPVSVRHIIDIKAVEQIKEFDDGGAFQAGTYLLRAPTIFQKINRDKEGSQTTRRQRMDSHAEGVEPTTRRAPRMGRLAQINAQLNHETPGDARS
jgi:hypothetical protein